MFSGSLFSPLEVDLQRAGDDNSTRMRVTSVSSGLIAPFSVVSYSVSLSAGQ